MQGSPFGENSGEEGLPPGMAELMN